MLVLYGFLGGRRMRIGWEEGTGLNGETRAAVIEEVLYLPFGVVDIGYERLM